MNEISFTNNGRSEVKRIDYNFNKACVKVLILIRTQIKSMWRKSCARKWCLLIHDLARHESKIHYIHYYIVFYYNANLCIICIKTTKNFLFCENK